LHGTVSDCPYTEYIDGKDIIDKDIGLDNLNPVRTNGILGVIPQYLFLAKDNFLIENLIHNLDGIWLRQLILIQIGQ
jgi:hypothetical protein